jgi:hypothetical protein
VSKRFRHRRSLKLRAPLKFRAEGLELRVALAIGRIVFRALNIADVVWAVVNAVCLASPDHAAWCSYSLR